MKCIICGVSHKTMLKCEEGFICVTCDYYKEKKNDNKNNTN